MPEVFQASMYISILMSDTGCLGHDFSDEPMKSVWTLSGYEPNEEFYNYMETLGNK